MKVIYIDTGGGINFNRQELNKYFPAIKGMLRMIEHFPRFQIKNSYLSIDEMTAFTNYVETYNQ